jgi:hypothetical protein
MLLGMDNSNSIIGQPPGMSVAPSDLLAGTKDDLKARNQAFHRPVASTIRTPAKANPEFKSILQIYQEKQQAGDNDDDSDNLDVTSKVSHTKGGNQDELSAPQEMIFVRRSSRQIAKQRSTVEHGNMAREISDVAPFNYRPNRPTSNMWYPTPENQK